MKQLGKSNALTVDELLYRVSIYQEHVATLALQTREHVFRPFRAQRILKQLRMSNALTVDEFLYRVSIYREHA